MVEGDSGNAVSKRRHKKSKYGCSNCKKRRVKCDEGFPICRNCSRRDEDCSYSNLRPPEEQYNILDAENANKGCLAVFNNEKARALAIAKQKAQDVEIGDIDPYFHQRQRGIQGDVDMDSEGDVAMQVDRYLPKIQLASNDGKSMYPSYLSHTVINNKVMLYYATVFYSRISPVQNYAKPWGEIPLFSYQYIHVCYILLSTMLFSMYHDCFDPRSKIKNYLGFKDINDYLVLAKLNYDAFQEEIMIARNQLKTEKQEVVAEFVALMLETLTFMFSPNLTVCDPIFIKRSIELNILATDVMPLLKAVCSTTEGVPLNYYSPTHISYVKGSQTDFFPTYLYQLCCQRPPSPAMSADDGDHPSSSDSSTPFDLRGEGSGADNSMSSPSTSDTEVEELDMMLEKNMLRSSLSEDQALKLAIDLLKKEYTLLLNDDDSDADVFRVFVRWPMLLSAQFANLLALQDNRALIIVAHYLMLLNSVKKNELFTRSVFVNELANIESILHEDYRSWLDIPKRCLGMM